LLPGVWCADAGQEYAQSRAQAGAVVSVSLRMEGGMLILGRSLRAAFSFLYFAPCLYFSLLLI